MLKKAMGTLLCAMAVAALASVSAQAAGDGVEGKVVKVDAAKGTLTVTSEGSEKTYTVTAQTQIVGPRGGIVHRRLHDKRFHEGLPITVVANGTTATQLLLGIDRKAGKSTAAAAPGKAGTDRSSGFRGNGEKTDEAAEDDDNEFPGKVKSVDADKNLLVVTLLTGKDRSFMVGGDAKFTVGRRVSQKGLSEPELKAGAGVTVVTDDGGKKVKEVKIAATAARRGGRRFGGSLRPQINQQNQ
jgi:hypothetical protein